MRNKDTINKLLLKINKNKAVEKREKKKIMIEELFRTIHALISYVCAFIFAIITDAFIKEGLVMLPLSTGLMTLACIYYALICDRIIRREKEIVIRFEVGK